MTRRELGGLAAAAIAANATRALAQTAGEPGPTLDIAEWSYHWYGVEHALLARGTMCNGGQMYVEHWIPREVRHPYPAVLIHGGHGQGSDWFSTPDGHRGLATELLEQGYNVYVLDRPGQGRCPYHPWVHGYFDREAPTFEAVAASRKVDPDDPAVAQVVAVNGSAHGKWPDHAGPVAVARRDAAGRHRSGHPHYARRRIGLRRPRRERSSKAGEGNRRVRAIRGIAARRVGQALRGSACRLQRPILIPIANPPRSSWPIRAASGWASGARRCRTGPSRKARCTCST